MRRARRGAFIDVLMQQQADIAALSTPISLNYFRHGSSAFEDPNLYGQVPRILKDEREKW
jgi:hypothetical protein